MNQYLWPWQTHVMIQHPWTLLAFFGMLSIPLSVISWNRQKK